MSYLKFFKEILFSKEFMIYWICSYILTLISSQLFNIELYKAGLLLFIGVMFEILFNFSKKFIKFKSNKK